MNDLSEAKAFRSDGLSLNITKLVTVFYILLGRKMNGLEVQLFFIIRVNGHHITHVLINDAMATN